MRLRPQKEKGDEVQIIHAKFVISSVFILSEIPKIVFITERRIQLVKEWVHLRFRNQYLFQPPIPFIFRDDGFRGRL
jgi:hypothetical protein